MNERISITTLGCDKNRCDSEEMAGILKNEGFTFVPNDNEADIIIVNTCAFIAAARAEAIDTIISKFPYKDSGTCKMLIVTGCLPQKHRAELEKELPEVDFFLGVDQYESLPQLIKQKLKQEQPSKASKSQKLLSTPKSYVYIKIADGCNNICSYCTIPSIRGRYRSRPQSEILSEIEHFASLGVPEFILVAQDLTKYGMDLPDTNLVALIRAVSRISAVKRIRLHYIYPNGITDELIDEMTVNPKVCKYVDIPLQHTSAKVLTAMNRRGSAGEYLNLITKLRTAVPGITIRSTFMIGFPGETDEDFLDLCNFLRETKLDYVGFFTYSREKGTPSYSMTQVPEMTKKTRLRAVEAIQTQILAAKNNEKIGSIQKVVCDYYDPMLDCHITRTQGQSPEVDPYIMVKGDIKCAEDCTIKIIGTEGKNLKGELI